MYNTIKTKYKLIKYKIGFVSRLKYFYCAPYKTEYAKFRNYIKLKIPKLMAWYKIFSQVIKKEI